MIPAWLRDATDQKDQKDSTKRRITRKTGTPVGISSGTV
jgi:hypothetical protein